MDLVEGIGRANSRKQSTNPNTPSFRKKKLENSFRKQWLQYLRSRNFFKNMCSRKICVLEKLFRKMLMCSRKISIFFENPISHKKFRNYTISKFSQKSKYFLSCTREKIPSIQLWTRKGTAASNLESVTKSVFET